MNTAPSASVEDKEPPLVSVLHVIGSLDARMGGSVRAPLDICAALVDAGHEPTLIGSVAPTDATQWLDTEYAHVRSVTFPRRFPKHYFNAPGLRRWVKHHVRDFDLVELHGIFTFPVMDVLRAASKQAVPFIVRPHGQLDPYDLAKHAHLKKVHGRLVVRPMLDKCEVVLATTSIEAERLVTLGATPHVEVAPLPVQGTPPGDGPEFRRLHHIPSSDFCVLFLGRFDDKKGLQFLIPAMAQLRRLLPDLRLVVAGTGTREEESRLQSLLSRYDAEQWVSKTGFLEEKAKADAYAACDIFALPSLNENFGITVVEALMAGLPCLLSHEVYIHKEPVTRGAAVVCSPEVKSVYHGLHELHGRDRVVMGERAREVARDVFSVQASTERLVEVYNGILARAMPEA